MGEREQVVRSLGGRLLCLGLATGARGLADGCFAVVLLHRVVQGTAALGTATLWLFLAAALLSPSLLLALVTAITGQFAHGRWLFALAASVSAGGVLLAAIPGQQTLWPLVLLACGTALAAAARDAFLCATAQSIPLTLNRALSVLTAGTAGLFAVGLFLGGSVPMRGPQELLAPLGLYGLALLAALLLGFPPNRDGSLPVGRGLAAFLRQTRRLLRGRKTWGLLFALTALAVVCWTARDLHMAPALPNPVEGGLATLVSLVQLLAIGSALGCLLAAVQWHPCRALSLVPVGATGLTVSLLCLLTGSGVSAPTLCVLAGAVFGLTEVPLRAAWLLAVPLDARNTGIALFQVAGVVRAALVLILLRALYLFQVAGEAGAAPPGSARRHLWLLLLLIGVWAVACWRLFIREWAEQVTELLLTPFSRVHVHEREHFPLQGPCIVLANHAAWFDPLWLTKEVPRRVTPLMISLFYDRPIIHWLMVHVVQAIRVPAANFRREAPELKEAIAVLDRDGCVMIFPEGWLRRREDQLLRPFGQGIWRILRERPATPVVACWIEGGWGSFTSFYNGPPMTNKRLDWRRRVDIVFGNPEVLNPSLLADQRATRNYLMRACLELRGRCLRPGKGAATP